MPHPSRSTQPLYLPKIVLKSGHFDRPEREKITIDAFRDGCPENLEIPHWAIQPRCGNHRLGQALERQKFQLLGLETRSFKAQVRSTVQLTRADEEGNPLSQHNLDHLKK